MPPPSPGDQWPPGYDQPGYRPPGYQQYGAPMHAQPPTNSGMAIAGMVLSLVGLIPCFWFLQLPGLLGVIFSAIGLKQTAGGARKGRGMAIAGLVVGVILLVVMVVVWLTLDCVRVGNSWTCT
jgi:Domain of unknown function (DUF4190)